MKEIVRILNCPICRRPTPLYVEEQTEAKDGRIIKGILACKGTPKHRFMIRYGTIILHDDMLREPSEEQIEEAFHTNSRKSRTT